MKRSIGNIPNLRGVTSFRGDSLKIDLGKTFEGELTAWMRKYGEEDYAYRSFEIIDNRYLFLDKNSTLDYYDNDTVTQTVEGKWHFQVKQVIDKDLETEVDKSIYQGTILFVNNVTGVTKIVSGDIALEEELNTGL